MMLEILLQIEVRYFVVVRAIEDLLQAFVRDDLAAVVLVPQVVLNDVGIQHFRDVLTRHQLALLDWRVLVDVKLLFDQEIVQLRGQHGRHRESAQRPGLTVLALVLLLG